MLDEPLGALDRKLREEMQIELKLLQSQFGITFVFVTHDQEEAMSMSNRIAIMLEGHIEQLGDPETVYERPVSAFVAGFIGRNNFWRGVATDGGMAADDGTVFVCERPEERVAGGQRALTAVRPESFTLVADGSRATSPTSSPARSPASPTSATRCNTSCVGVSATSSCCSRARKHQACFRATRCGAQWSANDVYQFSAAQESLVLAEPSSEVAI